MEASDIGPCPFNVGDIVEITGWWAESLHGKTFEVARAKVFDNDGEIIWVVAPTEGDEIRLLEVWDTRVLGYMREPGDDASWWWVGFLKLHSIPQLEND